MSQIKDLFEKIFILINTIKYLKYSQIFQRLLRSIVKPQIIDSYEGQNINLSKGWQHVELYNRKIYSRWEACFLNHKKKLNFPSDWNSEFPSRLWTYNLHYFEDLIAKDTNKFENFYKELVDLWVDQNPIRTGTGAEPCP